MQLADTIVESWRPIPDHSNYLASTLGRIKNRKTGRILKPQPLRSRWGDQKYLQIGLSLGSATHRITKSLHRLIAQTFLPDFSPTLSVNHRDTNKQNNAVENLEMVSHQENMDHAVAMGLIRGCQSRFTQSDVDAMKALRESGILVPEIAERFGASKDTVYSLLTGRRRPRAE